MYFHNNLIWSHKCKYYLLKTWLNVKHFNWHAYHSCILLGTEVVNFRKTLGDVLMARPWSLLPRVKGAREMLCSMYRFRSFSKQCDARHMWHVSLSQVYLVPSAPTQLHMASQRHIASRLPQRTTMACNTLGVKHASNLDIAWSQASLGIHEHKHIMYSIYVGLYCMYCYLIALLRLGFTCNQCMKCLCDLGNALNMFRIA